MPMNTPSVGLEYDRTIDRIFNECYCGEWAPKADAPDAAGRKHEASA
jgi:hypothetical protein